MQDAVDAGAASNFSLSVYDYYRGEAIQYVLTQYRNIETFEEMIALTSETPKNKTELTAALRAYRYYNQELTADEQNLVAPELVKKMNNAVLLNTNCEEVKNRLQILVRQRRMMNLKISPNVMSRHTNPIVYLLILTAEFVIYRI